MFLILFKDLDKVHSICKQIKVANILHNLFYWHGWQIHKIKIYHEQYDNNSVIDVLRYSVDTDIK